MYHNKWLYILQLCGTVTVYMALTQAPPKYSGWGNSPKQVHFKTMTRSLAQIIN